MDRFKNELLKLGCFHPIFKDDNKAVDFFIRHKFIPNVMFCTRKKCRGLMKIKKDKRNEDGKIFRCNVCRKESPLKNGNRWLKQFKMKFITVLTCIFSWTLGMKTYQTQFFGIDGTTYDFIRKKLIKFMKEDVQNNKIGGPDVKVQIVQIPIYDGKIKWPQSRLLFNKPTKFEWIVAGLEQMNSKRFFLELVSDLSDKTMLKLFQKHLMLNTIIVTDCSNKVFNGQLETIDTKKNQLKRIYNFIEILEGHYLIPFDSDESAHLSISDFLLEFTLRKYLLSPKVETINIVEAFLKVLEKIKIYKK